MGGRMVDFGGWDMPVQYPAGTIEEHLRTRKHAGLFDVSHMGEIDVRGSGAIALVNYLASNDASKLVDGQAQYSALTTPEGTVVDDLLVYRFGDDHLLLVVNAGTTEKDWNWIAEHRRNEAAQLKNVSSEYCQLALQGPDALGILGRLTDQPLSDIKYYHFAEGQVDGIPAIVSRTGYTGEDGFEIYFSPEHSEKLWSNLLEAGASQGMIPCGLGARNTLRLEASMCLYGHEIDDTTTPWEAGLGWICKPEKGEFLGRDILVRRKAEGLERTLVGFEMQDRLIARDGCLISIDGRRAGRVTSGSPAPFLKKNIGMAYVPAASKAPGTEIAVEIRGNQAPARIVPMPFYKRPK